MSAATTARGPATAVVWIASYPKSGNTWLQTVIRKAGRPDGFRAADIGAYRLIAEGREPVAVGGVSERVTKESTTVLKTHSPFLGAREIHPELGLRTAGFVYILRNPLDVLLSYINFTRIEYGDMPTSLQYQRELFIDLLGFDKPIPHAEWAKVGLDDIPRANLDHALERFTALGTRIPSIHNAGGSWLDHCRSWLEAGRTLPSVVVRYEELLSGPEAFLRLKALFEFPEQRILRVASKVTQKQREWLGKKAFFNKMTAYYYLDYFSAGVIGRFLDRFLADLTPLGYGDLPRSGAAVVK